ncbi:MAG: STT3 domain-containing protein, partial [Candidatus Methanoperedens sp.]|nr:STT3 domain-containing protein [Candidatus Methanoperedens sp.]
MGKKTKRARKLPENSTDQGSNNKTNKWTYFFLFLVFILALLFRFASIDSVFSGNEIIFPGFDGYYHLRLITYSVQNFPGFLWSDTYVNYPIGYNVGWMPFYDLAVAFITSLFTFGSPTIHNIETIAAIFPAVLGAITVIPIFFIGKELRDARLGILSALLFAIMPAHLAVSRFGLIDHHVAEVFLFTMIFLFLTLSIKDNKKINLIFAGTAGSFIGILVFTWSAAHIYIAVFSLFFIILYGVNLYKGIPSNKIILTGAVTGFTALFISVILYIFHWIPLYQVAGVVAFLSLATVPGIISNAMQKKKIHWLIYPAVIVIIAIFMLGIITFFPAQFGIFDEAINYLTRENIVGTIAETRPFADDYFSFISTLYFSTPFGFALIFAFIGLLYYIVSELGSKFAPEKLLFLISALAMILLTLQQVRFSYLSSIFVAILAAYFIYRMIFEENFVYNTRSIASLCFLILIVGAPTAYQAYAISKEPPIIAGDWRDSLIWLKNNTPATSYYDAPDKNPEYSVMAWWDYGNWIEYVAQRPVVANNFQAGVDIAARYFSADSEKIANNILDQRRARYVIVDDETGFGYRDFVYGKFKQVIELAGKNRSNYAYTFDVPGPNYATRVNLLNDNYYNTLYARL